MGTKLKPGTFDCYANAEPDEPMFVLLARDESAPKIVRDWVREREIRKGRPWPEIVDPSLPQFDDKAREALACADAMERWRKMPSRADSAVRASGEPQKPPAELIIRMRAVIEAVRAVGAKGHWDAPHWTLRVPAREANALFDLAYELDPALASASPSDDGARQPQKEDSDETTKVSGLLGHAGRGLDELLGSASSDRARRIPEIRARLDAWQGNCAEEGGNEDYVHIFECHSANDIAWLLNEFAAASDDGAAREPGLDLEPIKARINRDYGGGEFWSGSDEVLDIKAMLAEIERQRADLYVSRKHAADLQTELTLLERTVQPPVSDSLRYLIDHPVTQQEQK